MAAGEHGDREAPAVERVDQLGEQLARGAGVGMEEAVHDQEPLAPGLVGRRPVRLRPAQLLAGDRQVQRAPQDAQVDREAGVAQVPGIEGDPLVDAQPIAAVDLRPAGDAGRKRDRLGDPLPQVARREGPRADERHLAAQHVDELRQLVEPRAPQDAPDRRGPCAVRERCAIGIAGAAQGAELVERERAHAAARMHLAEQDRAALVEEHHEGDESHQRHEQEQRERAHPHLDGAAGAEIGALGRARPARRLARGRVRRHAQHLGQDVQLHAVPGAAVAGRRSAAPAAGRQPAG